MSLGATQPNANTGPELAVRRRLHALGLRYFVGRRPVRSVNRTADIVFPKPRLAVFIDGCFWHYCPDHYYPPKTNVEYWRDKIEKNTQRDFETTELLAEHGWHTLRFWEHEDPDDVATAISAFVSGALVAT